MPAALDVQTRNNGAKTGKAESGDSITYTFAGAVVPSLVLAGWNGSATHLPHGRVHRVHADAGAVDIDFEALGDDHLQRAPLPALVNFSCIDRPPRVTSFS